MNQLAPDLVHMEYIDIKWTKSQNCVFIENWPFAHVQNVQNINELWSPIKESD